MRLPRYRVHDGPLLRRLMRNPESDGVRHTVRSLGEATGLSPSKIHKLITEERPTVTPAEADRIAEALAVQRKALFAPTSSPYSNGERQEEQ